MTLSFAFYAFATLSFIGASYLFALAIDTKPWNPRWPFIAGGSIFACASFYFAYLAWRVAT